MPWIEEGLFYSGPEAPAGVGRPRDWVELPHESYLGIPKSRLVAGMRAHPRAVAAGIGFDHFLRLVEGLLHFHHHETLNELKQDYLLFSPDAGRAARAGLSPAELLDAERRFLGNFMRAAVLGNFTPMSDADYRRASEQTYLLDVPVDIDWRDHDADMLAGFIGWTDGDNPGGRALRQELRLDAGLREFLSLPEEFGTNALVLHRGIDRDQATGRFLVQRLDLVLNGIIEILTYPIVKPIQVLLDRRRRRRGTTNLPVAATAPKPAPAREAERSTVFERRWVRRKNLRNQGVLRGFFKVQKLQEPVLRQVIVLFRLTGNPAIHLKMFRDIPLADAEIVFPKKIIRMGSFDIAMLVVSVVAAIPALANVVLRGGGASIALLVGIGVLIVKTVARYLDVRGKYMARMTQNLYEKNQDNSLGVLQYLVDSLEEQEYKEAVLVYFVLWTEDRAMSATEIDAAVERLISERFGGLEVDFEMDDALRKVIDRGSENAPHALPIVDVVEAAEGNRTYVAKPLPDALRILDERWDDLFQYSSGSGASTKTA